MLLCPTTPKGLLPLAIRAALDVGIDHDEAVSAANLAVTEVCRRYPEESRSWVIREAAKRRAIDYWRSARGREGQKPRPDFLEDHVYSEPSHDPTTDVVDRLAAQQEARLLLEQLDERERFIVTRLADGWTLREVGEHIGISEAGVSHARKRIRTRLEPLRAALSA